MLSAKDARVRLIVPTKLMCEVMEKINDSCERNLNTIYLYPEDDGLLKFRPEEISDVLENLNDLKYKLRIEFKVGLTLDYIAISW